SRIGRRAGRRVLCRFGRHRVRHRPLWRPLCARPHVCLHPHRHGDCRRAHRSRAVGGAGGISVARRTIVMTDIRAIKAHIPLAADEPAAPASSSWRRLEPALLGVGSIALLLVMWELTPHLVTMSAGTKLFYTTPSQVAGTLWKMFATGTIWAPLRV